MVSAWANTNQLTLGQVKVDEKSNEITAIPKLLEILALEGCIVTIDAMGCQTKIAEKIKRKEADYILAVKSNQPRLKEDIWRTIQSKKACSESQIKSTGHGREEMRNCMVYNDLSLLTTKNDWCEIKSVIKVDSTRHIQASGKEERETRSYISSLDLTAEKMSNHIRAHWGIENKLHWVLDVAFGEDKSKKRAGYSAQNFSIINRVALNLLRNNPKKRSVKGKRLDAGWDNSFLLNIIQN
jgi:predicted transposase YbfD/YdcC